MTERLCSPAKSWTTHGANPDDDLALMCRQFQRSREREAILRNMLVTAVTLIDGLLEAMDMPDIPAVQRGRAVAARIRASLETRQ